MNPVLPSHIDITSPEAYTDIPTLLGAYSWLRSNQPISWVDRLPYRPFWAVTRHADIIEIEKQNDLFINEPRLTLLPREIEDASLQAQPTPLESMKMLFSLLRYSARRWEDFKSLSRSRAKAGNSRRAQVRTVIEMDAPDHRKYRMLTYNWFMGSGVSRLEDRVRVIAKKYVARMLECDGECDFAGEIANWYPLEVIMTILGLPAEDAPRLLVWTQQLLNASDPEIQKSNLYGSDVMLEMYAYFSALISRLRDHPGDDLASVIVHSKVDDKPLELVEILSYFLIIATAGHETTSTAVTGGLHAFTCFPEQFRRLQQSPQLATTASNEIARWTSAVRHFTRTATADYVMHDVNIKAGQSVGLFYLSANHDSRVFERPGEFLIDRQPNPHLAFGHGVHYCLGKKLALMEIELFFSELSQQIDHPSLSGEVGWVKSNFMGGIKYLPVRYTSRDRSIPEST